MRPSDELPFPVPVLAICAHPDDESFGLGAIISEVTGRGARVDVVCLTRGESSTLGSDRDALADDRSLELAEASTILGVSEVALHDFPDGRLSEVALEDLVAAAAPSIATARLLLVFDENGVTGHPDHIRATEVALVLAEQLDLPVLAWAVDRRVATTLRSELGAPFAGREPEDVHLRLRVDRTRQLAAMRCHASQLEDNPVPTRRIELTGDVEPLRWLRSPGRGRGTKST